MSHVSLIIPDTDEIVASLDTRYLPLPLSHTKYYRESSRRWYFKDYLSSHPDPESLLAPSINEGESDDEDADDLDVTDNNNAAGGEGEVVVEEQVAEVTGNGAEPKPTYRTTVQPHPPVRVNIRNRLTSWELDLRGRKSNLYSVLLGISAGNASVDQIESIEFRIFKKNEYSEDFSTPSEFFNKQDIRDLVTGTGLARWKLHNQFKKEDLDSVVVELEIRTTQNNNDDSDNDDNSLVDPGFFELHYMELVKEPIECTSFSAHDPSLKVHKPYVWSINVNYSDELSEDLSPTMEIVTYAISGDGSHVATVAGIDQHVFLDVWDLRNPHEFHTSHSNSTIQHHHHSSNTSVDKIENAADKHSISSHPSKDPPVLLSDSTTPANPVLKPFSPRCSARVSAIELPVTYNGRQVGVSLSWDASMVAILDATTLSTHEDSHTQSSFAVFDHICGPHSTIDEKGKVTPFAATVLRSSEQHLDLAATDGRLKNFFGYGKFHISALENQDIKDELFVTCNEQEVNVYGVYPKWRHIHTVRLDRPQDTLLDLNVPCMRLIDTLRGRNFVWDVRNDDGIAVYDVEDGSVISFSLKHRLHPNDLWFREKTPFCLSNDGSVLALYQERVISTHWVGSGTLRGKFLLPDRYKIPDDIQFIRGDTHLLIRVETRNEDLGRGLLGLIVRVEDMALVDSFSLPGKYLALPATSARSGSTGGSQDLLTAHQSTLDLIRLEDRIAKSWSNPKPKCDDGCRAKLSPIKSDDKEEIVSPSGIRFMIETCMETLVKLTNEIQLTSVIISASFKNGEPVEKLVMPELERRSWGGSYVEKFFLDCGTRLVIISRELFTLWSLPTTLEGNLKLLMAVHAPDGAWRCCPHQQLFSAELYMCISADGSPVVNEIPRVGAVFTRESAESFLMGIPTLADLYKQGDETFRREILRYVGKHLNTHPVPEDPNKSILPYICERWSLENHDTLQPFVADLLDSPFGRWVPKQDFDRQSNPLEMMLEKAKTQPQAIAMVETLIDYCIRQARAEDDAHFLVPVLNSLPILSDPSHPHQELAQRTLRRLAYIPVKSRSLIIDHHQTTYPLEFRWKFWTQNTRPLYKCKSPVVQMTRDQVVDPINGNFSADFYVTSDDLLWSLRKDRDAEVKSAHRPLVKAVRPNGVLSWIKAVVFMMWYKRKLWSTSAIDVHPYAPQALDHPAISAIVEYKWNKIGYKYWLMRFIFQCLYYILVLTTVFLQVYNDQGNRMAGLFVAIVAFAGIFLWLELIQMIRDKKNYLSSIYNFVDLVVFGLPLAGSINQLCIIYGNTPPGGNPALLSFSVLFVFLHFLFELRVNKSVCHFVTIIIQIFEKIKVFFFIFAGGILAFTIAILHLLRSPANSSPSCTGDACEQIDFPLNFLRAMSATYFFMGGIYDPISPLFNTDRVAFHLMMIVFFFFTVILMLNVLISLISLAFSDGDETWRLTWIENRLRYVESAENMSYHIPGFRERHNWFPKEIYYSATPQQVRDYNKVSESLDEQNSIVTVKETSPSSQAILGVGAGDDSMHVHSHTHSHSHSHSPEDGVVSEDKKEEEVVVQGHHGHQHHHDHHHHQHASGSSTTASATPSFGGAGVAVSGIVSEVAQLKYQLQESQGQMLSLLQQLTKQQEQNVVQQTQLREQQQLFASQLGELQGHILTLLKTGP
ncbi:hypothetical protein K457DRAFT_129940 [Linnemannia elongata AG-77]|uniref:Ion transport domain-containing protein n=1 Tax=Linnemannia elongata AG-77 TaxID=1314771 RepID=A0A197JIQ3_9FUNG|nr:hypothetical protein K457DRAFT_129940 [Linnemannia elongata AG-77]